MTEGPTTGAADGRAWSASPAKAFIVRGVVVVTPVLASFITARLVGPLLWHPSGWLGFCAFVVQVGIIGSAAAVATDRAIRRVLPLATLLNMTLVFPDRAPSRFKVALRSGTLKRLVGHSGEQLPVNHQEAAEELVAMVVALGHHERLTRGHTERVRAYTDLIGQELGLSAEERQQLTWGAMIHDIGKLTVPAEILASSGRPTEEEWQLIRGHPSAGAEMVEPLADWLGDWRLAAGQHHERWDGDGYPQGLAGTEISLAGRIVAVADAFDVITAKRSYKGAMPAEAARQEMVRCAGTQFDPAVVRALLQASLGRDRSHLGFLGWLTELGGISAIPRGVAQAAATGATAVSVVAAAATGGGMLPEANSETDEITAFVESSPSSLPFVAEGGATGEGSKRPTPPTGDTPPQDDPALSEAPTPGASLPVTDHPIDTGTPTTTVPSSNPTSSVGQTSIAGSFPFTSTTTSGAPSSTSQSQGSGSSSTSTQPPGTATTTTSPLASSSTTTAGVSTTTTASLTTTTTTPATTTTTTAPTTTTTNPATTTTTTAPTTTLPHVDDWILGNGSLGAYNVDTNATDLLPLVDWLWTGPLVNYDQDRDSEPGLLIETGSGTSETDSTKMQRWVTSFGGNSVVGPMELRIWVAAKDFDTSKTGRLEVAIYDCNATGTSCSQLATGDEAFDQSSFGSGFGELVISLGSVNHSFGGGRALLVKVAAHSSSGTDLFLAYATGTHPAQLILY